MATLDLLKNSRRNRGLKGPVGDAWTKACDELGLDFHRSAGNADGVVQRFDVSVSLMGSNDNVRTKYVVTVDAPHAPAFKLTPAPLDGDPIDLTFEGMVSIDTQNRSGMLDFLTTDRRQAIMEVLQNWSHVTMTNSSVAIATDGVETNAAAIVSTVKQLVSVADSFAPCWAEVQLDEVSVLDDLFNAPRSAQEVADRFDRLYKIAEVNWCGEILQVGEIEATGRRVVVFIGTSGGPLWSCDNELGQMWAGRVVALTTIDPDVAVQKGDVVSFTGALRHLDAEKRVFRIEDFATLKPLQASTA